METTQILKFIRNTFLFLGSIGFLAACSHQNDTQPDVSEIHIPYHTHPFYLEFAAIDTNKIAEDAAALEQKYPDFLAFYLKHLVNIGYPLDDSRSQQNLHYFLTHPDYRSLFDTVNKVFPNTEKQDRQLLQAFKYAHYYDSSIKLPSQVYYFVSGLNLYTAVTHNDSVLGIGLDMFLGDYPPYAAVGIPDYALQRFTADNMPVWAMRAVYQNKYPDQTEGKNLLDLLLMKGKELYFLQKTLPDVAEHIRLGYAPQQLSWCKENEEMIYNFFIRQNLLYENNLQKTLRFINDGPNSAGMPPESPGNVGSYIGLRLVNAYAEKTGASMAEILALSDGQKVLEASRYKP